MSSIVSGHHCNWSLGGAVVQEHILCRGRFYSNKVPCPGDNHGLPCRGLFFSTPQSLASSSCYRSSTRKYRPVFSSTVDDPRDQDDPEEDGASDKDSSKGETGGIDSELLRENLERIVGSDDSSFSGIDLATLIRNKYGRSYDVQLIKKISYKFHDAGVHGKKSPRFECHVEVQGTGELILVMNESRDKKILVCGCIMTTSDITKYQNGSVNLDFQATEKLHIRNVLGFHCTLFTKYFLPLMQSNICANFSLFPPIDAHKHPEVYPEHNCFTKHMEITIMERSFPLTEEEYILRLDDVANTLKCWGAVSHIRNSLEKSKERPRIGKAVSIFIDMDESGGRANEWIYK
ncbi:hypothetical protein SADUNF_Sadunf10G0129100 [Salix dunnii]|uniref:Uncharacterized protein n=1 Tax=Salix dunnii TaxID=1413687 RepID=A0A835JRV7_9ROSI|nr:hypothetical protein SADUNF_Sadunf10G0129100 [Salix dunnii]